MGKRLAQSGNGIDIGAVYALLTEMSARLDRALVVLEEHSRTLTEHTRQLLDLNASVTELNETVGHYHGAVVSKGLHYSDLEGRMIRVERHLKLGPA